jgi:hypothetical protein
VRDLLEARGQQLRGLALEQLAQRGVDVDEAAVRGDERHPRRGRPEGALEARAGLLQPCRGAVALRHVARHAGQADDLAGGVAQRRHRECDLDLRAVLAALAGLEGDRPPGAQLILPGAEELVSLSGSSTAARSPMISSAR